MPAQTILVVDDDDDVRQTIGSGLARCGYKVLTARSGKQALAILVSPVQVDLLLTDVVMPRMDGVTLAHNATAVRPGLPVHFMSGCVADIHIGDIEGKLIRKPFRAEVLEAEIKKTLGNGQGQEHGATPLPEGGPPP